MVGGVTRGGHGLKTSKFWKGTGIVGVRQIAGLRIVVTHQSPKLDASGSEVIHLQRRVARQFSLNSQRPLPNIGRPLVELSDQNESWCAGALEGLIETEIGPERFG